MALYAQEMHKALTGRAGDWLAQANAWPHVTMAAAFAVSAWAAYECSIRIVDWGGLTLRFSVNFLAAYAAFLLCLGLWLWTKPMLDRPALLEGASEDIETKNAWDDEATEFREHILEQTEHNVRQQEGAHGLAGLALLVMIIGPLFVAMHMIWYARWHLGHLLVLSGKVRHRTLMTPPTAAWLVVPFQQTVWAAVILLVHYVLLGLLLQWALPQATTLAEVMQLARR